ncbi:MAG: nucleotidyl transferase AbiEii/AbiGii toxin family protein [Pyrinomonadaceae bacterium]
MHALISHENLNSRSKDVYDLAILLPKANSTILAEALKRCFEFRQTVVPSNFTKVLKSLDTKSLERGWVSAIASVPDKPHFNTTLITIIRLIGEMKGACHG